MDNLDLAEAEAMAHAMRLCVEKCLSNTAATEEERKEMYTQVERK